jgi:hypothetical protein
MSKNSWMIKRDDILIIWLFFYARELKRMTFLQEGSWNQKCNKFV